MAGRACFDCFCLCEITQKARLVPLPKPDGGLRPILVQEVLTRLVSSCALKASTHLSDVLAPLQVGVGVPGGADTLACAVAAGIDEEPDCATIQTDMSNAFGTARRSGMLQECAQRAPPLYPWAKYQLRQHTRCWVQGAPAGTPPIMLRTGVPEGNLLSPALYAFNQQPALEAAARQFPQARIMADHDDVVLQARGPAAVRAFAELTKQLQARGMAVSMRKSACIRVTQRCFGRWQRPRACSSGRRG